MRRAWIVCAAATWGALALVVIYLAAAFAHWAWNPADWSGDARGAVAVVGVIGGVVAAFLAAAMVAAGE